MNTHKAFILGVALLSTIGVKAQFAIDNYKAVFTSSPQHVPTTKSPDAPFAGNGDIGITMGVTPDKLCFYIGKNDFWRAYPVYPGGIALPCGLDIAWHACSGRRTYDRIRVPSVRLCDGCIRFFLQFVPDLVIADRCDRLVGMEILEKE